VSVGDNFLSLETTSYHGRTEFLESLEFLVEKMQETVQPDLVERIGLRYINRLSFKDRLHLAELVQPEVLGVIHENLGKHLTSTFSETRFSISPSMTVNGKWGLLPGGQSYDPTVLPPIEQQSWILDIDGISEDGGDFAPTVIVPVVDQLADIDYRLFRFAVTHALLREYGGEP
jgi:uncharacterized protein (TIGR04255 family)